MLRRPTPPPWAQRCSRSFPSSPHPQVVYIRWLRAANNSTDFALLHICSLNPFRLHSLWLRTLGCLAHSRVPYSPPVSDCVTLASSRSQSRDAGRPYLSVFGIGRLLPTFLRHTCIFSRASLQPCDISLRMSRATIRRRLTPKHLIHIGVLCILVTVGLVSGLPTGYSADRYSQLPLLARTGGKMCNFDFRSTSTNICDQNWKYVFDTVNGKRKFVRARLTTSELGSTRVPENTNCGDPWSR